MLNFLLHPQYIISSFWWDKLSIQVLSFVIIVVGTVGQTLINQFSNKNNTGFTRKQMNQMLKEQEEARKKNKNKPPLPVFNKDQLDKRPRKRYPEPTADDTVPNKDPDINTTDTNIVTIPSRNIPDPNKPNPPSPPPNPPNPTRTPIPDPIRVARPPFLKQTGKFIYQPIEDVEIDFYSMPTDGSNKADYTEVYEAVKSANKAEQYLKFLGDAKFNDIEKYNLSDLSPLFLPVALNVNSDLALVAGSEVTGKLAEAYENYSDGFLSDPLFFIPKKVNVQTIKGIDQSRRRRYGTEIDQRLKPENPEISDIILDNDLFQIPKTVTLETLLEFAGNAATHQGGAEKWELYKKNPSIINDPNFFKVPSSNDILNENVPSDAPKYQKQNLKIDSLTELFIVTAGVLYTKTGLHEFPSEELPGVKNPDPIDPNNPNDQLSKSSKAVRIGSLAAALSYAINWFNFKVGDFPAEVEVPDPTSTDPDKTKKEKVNISDAITNLLTIGTAGLALTNFGNNVNLKNAGQIEAAKNAALKGQECSCAMLANSGFNTKPKARCGDRGFNFLNAKGFDDMLKNTTGCYEGVENEDIGTIKDMLQNIMFASNLIKSAVFKGEKDLENQEKILEDLLKGKINDEELKEFIKQFNEQKTLISKNYPIKAKIVKEEK